VALVILLAAGSIAASVTSAGVAAPSVGRLCAAPSQVSSSTGEYVAFLASPTGSERVGAELARRYKFDLVGVYSTLGGFAAKLRPSQLAQLCADPRIAAIGADRKLSLMDEGSSGLQRIGGSTNREDQTVSLPFATSGGRWQSNTGTGVGVAVLDSGIDAQHSDLDSTPGANCVTGKTLSGPTQDDSGHGTAVAGIIGAKDNGVGTVGVAPGATLYAVKVADSQGHASDATLICGLNWVLKHKQSIRVVNVSLNDDTSRQVTPSRTNCRNASHDMLHVAVCKVTKAGITIVVAAGNEARDAGPTLAGYEEVIAVGSLSDSDGRPGAAGPPVTCPGQASNDDDSMSFDSNYGAVVDIFAPGQCIATTSLSGGYSAASGTSMAAPHVTGAVALLLAAGKTGNIKSQLLQDQEPGPIDANPGPSAQGVLYVGTPLLYELLDPASQFCTSLTPQADALLVIDPSTNDVLDTIGVGPCAQSAAASPDGSHIYVTGHTPLSGTEAWITIINARSNEVVGTASVPGVNFAGQIAVSRDSKVLYVTTDDCRSSPNLNGACLLTYEIDGDQLFPRTENNLGIAFAGGVVASPVFDEAYVIGEPQCGYDPWTGQEIHVNPCHKGMLVRLTYDGAFISKDWGPECLIGLGGNLAIDPKGLVLYSANRDDCGAAYWPYANNTVSRMPAAGGGSTTFSVGNAPRGLAVDPRGAFLYVGLAGGTVATRQLGAAGSPMPTFARSANNYGVGVTPNSALASGGSIALIVKP
jgi:subtilisin